MGVKKTESSIRLFPKEKGVLKIDLKTTSSLKETTVLCLLIGLTNNNNNFILSLSNLSPLPNHMAMRTKQHFKLKTYLRKTVTPHSHFLL